MATITKKATQTGTVEIKKCGFNTRPKLVVPGPAGEETADIDVLPDLFREFEGKKVRVTVEVVTADSETGKSSVRRNKK